MMNNNISRVHENLEKIIVDRLFWKMRLGFLKETSNSELMQAFDYRKKPVHRLK